ncbi:Rossmann-like and DUF2520 domain-containing protein [Pedobacter glucosidilyticus]|uniref:Rossmann-like and DUF2520 domain-containing protein n=1 Tax=Pedobacter glucosidilyticus TaxID=1122941 RepID=UPI00041FE28C|nr:Rossmann-like and DUF2520 domain-containing protein [Pedobacter glucosidilyticus]
MNIAVLGAGNIAWHLSKALIHAGHPVKQIWNRTAEKAVALALEIGADSITHLNQIDADIDLIIIAVSDEVITSIAKELQLLPQQLLVHTSGSTALDVLLPYTQKVGVLYPLQTFSKAVQVDFSQIPIAIEAFDESSTQVLFNLAKALSTKTYYINTQQRLMLHTAAVFACNFTNHFYTIAQTLMQQSGLDFNLIRPLIQETAAKVQQILPSEAQTGPAKRNDQLTIQKHLELLQTHTAWKLQYQQISQDIVKMYAKDTSSLK